MKVRSLLTGLFASSLAPIALASVAFAQGAPGAAPAAAQPAPSAPPILAPSAASAEAPAPAVTASAAIDSAESEPGTARTSLAGRFEGGLRTGISFGLGKAGGNDAGAARNVNDIVEYRVPIWIDLGYRVSDPLTLGVYAQLGLGGGGDCLSSCNASDLRIGAQALWHASTGGLWLGAGLGYEWLSRYELQVTGMPIEQAGENAAQFASRRAETIGGPELTLQAGLDLELEPGLSVGPYVSASVGQYLTDSFDCDGVACRTGSGIDGSATHAWLGLGVRGSYAP
ncbi:MAG: autotransporter domain-containing protein [Polyangiaceae bacterium]